MIGVADWISLAINGFLCATGCLALRAARKNELAMRNAEPFWKREKRQALLMVAEGWKQRFCEPGMMSTADECKRRLDEVLEELRMLDEADPLANEIDALVRRTEKVKPK